MDADRSKVYVDRSGVNQPAAEFRVGEGEAYINSKVGEEGCRQIRQEGKAPAGNIFREMGAGKVNRKKRAAIPMSKGRVKEGHRGGGQMWGLQASHWLGKGGTWRGPVQGKRRPGVMRFGGKSAAK